MHVMSINYKRNRQKSKIFFSKHRLLTSESEIFRRC